MLPAGRQLTDSSFHSQAEAVLLGDLQHPLPQVLAGLGEDDGAWQRDGPLIPPLKLLREVKLWEGSFIQGRNVRGSCESGVREVA